MTDDFHLKAKQYYEELQAFSVAKGMSNKDVVPLGCAFNQIGADFAAAIAVDEKELEHFIEMYAKDARDSWNTMGKSK